MASYGAASAAARTTNPASRGIDMAGVSLAYNAAMLVAAQIGAGTELQISVPMTFFPYRGRMLPVSDHAGDSVIWRGEKHGYSAVKDETDTNRTLILDNGAECYQYKDSWGNWQNGSQPNVDVTLQVDDSAFRDAMIDDIMESVKDQIRGAVDLAGLYFNFLPCQDGNVILSAVRQASGGRTVSSGRVVKRLDLGLLRQEVQAALDKPDQPIEAGKKAVTDLLVTALRKL
ncbi:MAG: hypothetical protein HY822_10405 [Acidobacteria bacterium]|nr:hypothetical protein [Acidobacteriota bacterium]